MLNTVVHILRSDFVKGIRWKGQLRSFFATVYTQTPQPKELRCFPSTAPVYRSVSITVQPLHNHQHIRGKSKKSGKRETRASSSDDLDDDDAEQDTGDAYDDLLGARYV
uniref:Uncharacterized protein n=1 Tax=Anopheles atroparvus TaxID=41427 RepID=A0AAG5CT03_ANOAO